MKIEEIVNEKIWASISSDHSSKPIAESKRDGSNGSIGRKYGDIVRVVSMGDYSIELCGGCHVANTSAIGVFCFYVLKLLRKVEGNWCRNTTYRSCKTGGAAYHLMNEQIHRLNEAAEKLKANPKDILTRIDNLLSDMKEIQRENESLAAKLFKYRSWEHYRSGRRNRWY